MKITTTLCCLLLFAVSLRAQEKKTACSWTFHSINNVGLLEGQTGSAFQLQTVNGAQFKSWFTGAGVGLDFYKFRSIPLFLDLRKEFFSGMSKLVVYADMGVSFTWATEDQKNPYLNNHYGNGLYNDFGLGYKSSVGKKSALLLSVGYSFKKVTETYDPVYMVPMTYMASIAPPSYPSQKTNYSLNRLSLKIGWEF